MICSYTFSKRFNLGLFGNTCFLRLLQEAFMLYSRMCKNSKMILDNQKEKRSVLLIIEYETIICD